MRNKIFSGLLFLSTAAVIIASVLIAVIMYQGSMTTMQRDLRQEATFIKMGLEQSGKSYLQALTMESGKLTRVTLIAPDGRVIYDNHVAAEKMLNHKDREEVQEALASGICQKKLFILRCGWIMVIYCVLQERQTLFLRRWPAVFPI